MEHLYEGVVIFYGQTSYLQNLLSPFAPYTTNLSICQTLKAMGIIYHETWFVKPNYCAKPHIKFVRICG